MKKEKKKNPSPLEAEAANDKLVIKVTLAAMAVQTIIFTIILVLLAVGV